MRLNELVGKEVINLTDGTRLGVIRNAQAMVDVDTGRIESFLVPFTPARGLLSRRQRLLAVPWRAIRRFGPDLLIVEIRTPREDERRRGAVAVGTEA
ncbi:MAG: YlmC/YmxH family sporulation protein [Patescibacteria group bacterium]